MNKLLVAAMMLFGTMQAKAEITVTTENATTPLTFKVIEMNSSNTAKDANGAPRLIISSASTSGGSCTIYLYNSSGVRLGIQEEEADTCTNVRATLSMATKENPVTVTVDRTTRKVINLASPVDPLAQIKTQENAG